VDKIRLEITEDGTHTLYSPQTGEHYHSIHGARQESDHVFLLAGLKHVLQNTHVINLLEVGFGTGLNCLLTLAVTVGQDIKLEYHGLEPFPVEPDLAEKLNFCDLPDLSAYSDAFIRMHTIPSGELCNLGYGFNLLRIKEGIGAVNLEPDYYNLVYFDAFSPAVVPDLWNHAIFEKIRKSMQTGGVLVTYCAKGDVRRAMQQSGFKVERLPGPPGKREILRAIAV